jgi:hypothetical protein
MLSFPEQPRLRFGFEAADWLFLASGFALTAFITAVLVLLAERT